MEASTPLAQNQPIGKVSLLRRYPVKSMAGETLDLGFVSYSGLAGDRVYAFIGLSKKPSFPWLTARQRPALLRYQPRFVSALDPENAYPDKKNFQVLVTTPDGKEYAIEDPAFLEALQKELECECTLRFSEKGMADARPLSLISSQTITALESELQTPFDQRRFRMNLLVEWSNTEAFFEDTLVGKQLQIGETLTVLVSKKDPCCKIVDLDPDTAERNVELLTAVAQGHGNCAGVYCVVIREGQVRPGDEIRLLE